jgi:hypothetical protein
MWLKVKDLSTEQRLAIESLLGRALADDESLNLQPARVLSEAPTGDERARAYRLYLDNLDEFARRAEGVPAEELDAIVDEACDHVRHSPS